MLHTCGLRAPYTWLVLESVILHLFLFKQLCGPAATLQLLPKVEANTRKAAITTVRAPDRDHCFRTNGSTCLQIVLWNLSCKNWHQASPARPPGLEGDLLRLLYLGPLWPMPRSNSHRAHFGCSQRPPYFTMTM